ncbi:MAG: TIGR00366 family protein, partial [Balneolales bacterium]|nr:TIGR00366 family protein [Balneolales bacterium]
ITAIGTLVAGYGIGYGIAFMNPFTLVLAQNVAGLPPLSGWEFRLILVIPFLLVGFHHVWSYAKKVLKDPKASYVYGIDSSITTQTSDGEYPELNARRKWILSVTVLTLGLLVFGISQYGWYLVELSALFLALAIVIGLMSGFGVNITASEFTKGAAELTGTALLIGFARSIALLMEDGQVLHTVVQALASPLAIFGAELAAVGMLIIQSGLNFFIPSGSGQAFVSMPLMGPIGDLVGVSRQVSVLAFQFGDGLMNMIVPTNPVLMGILGLAGIPYAKWLKFIVPLILKLLALAAVAMVIAVQIGFS